MAETVKEDAKRRNLSAATFQDFVEELSTLGDQKDRIVGKIRNRRKAAKEAGINLGEMDAVLKLKTMDTQEVKDNEADRLQYAKWLKVDLGFQASLELPEPDEKQVARLTKFDTHRAGYEAGKRGDPRNTNPHEPGTVAHPFWDQGWADGDNDVFQNAAKPKARVAKKGAGGGEMGPTDEQQAATPEAPAATETAGDATAGDPPTTEPAATVAGNTTIQ